MKSLSKNLIPNQIPNQIQTETQTETETVNNNNKNKNLIKSKINSKQKSKITLRIEEIDLKPQRLSNLNQPLLSNNLDQDQLISPPSSIKNLSNSISPFSPSISESSHSYLIRKSNKKFHLNHLILNLKSKSSKTWFSITFIGLLIISITFYAFSTFHLKNSQLFNLKNLDQSNYLLSDSVTDINQFPENLITKNTICSYCNCKLNRTNPPLLINLNQTPKSRTRPQILSHVWTSIRDIYCQHAWLGEGPALDLLLATDLSNPIKSYIQWRLELLKSDLPTAYIFTKTSWAGRTKHLRYAYFKRHILTIRTHMAIIKQNKWPETGSQARWGQKRQLIWIIVEDGQKLENDVAQELASADIPYIYFAYGPTHHFGNAQQNAAYSLIHRLSDPTQGGFLGHGPILSIDDDSNFLPELLVMIWATKRIGVWPIGNLGPHGWEGPIYDENHKLIGWEAGAIKDRKFPIDNGAFAFSSELLGNVIKGPRYWPTDISGGENEFISLIVKSKEEIEPLCYNCHVSWHNEPLPPACRDLQQCP